MKQFKGRVLAGGSWKGEAVVSHQGVNTLATFQKSALKNAKQVYASDQNNPDIFEKNITGKALCLPITIGSTTGGLVIQTVCAMKINPAAFLFSEHIDSLGGKRHRAGAHLGKFAGYRHRYAGGGISQRRKDGRHAGNFRRRHGNRFMML